MKKPLRDELLKALASCAGIPHAEMGPTVCKRLSKLLAVIEESTPGVDLEEMRRRYRKHRQLFPACTVTPESISKHWTQLGDGKPFSAISGAGLAEPENWRSHVDVIFPEEETGATGSYFARMGWDLIPKPYQEKIIRKCPKEGDGGNVVKFTLTG